MNQQGRLSPTDGILAVLGALALAWTFLPWWTWKVMINPVERSTMTVTAWDQANSGYMAVETKGQSVNGEANIQ